jgi:hypothetical protein
MRRAFGDAVMTLGSAMVLVLALVAMDDRVREQISLRLSAQPTVELARTGSQVRNLTGVMFEAAKYQSVEHAPLVIFAVAGTVLFVFMLRT